MIEVEKKFILKEGDKERLIKDAEFVSEKTHTDVYFDTPGWKLALKDVWLRKRNDKFELKVPVENGPIATNHFHEFETEKEIAEQLALPPSSNSLEQQLQDAGFVDRMRITTTRAKYKKDGFILDFDVTDFGYEGLEIELMVERESDTPVALEKITEFAKAHGLEVKRTRGKVLAYVMQFHPDLYKAQFPNGDGF